MADDAHRITDEKLEKMERHLSAIYSRAEKEIEKTAADYLERFQKQDAEKLAQVSSGKITQKEYQQWRTGKIMYGKRYTEMKQQVAAQLLNVNKTAMAYINEELPEVYALNYNALEPTVEGVGGYSFTLTDADTVKNLATSDKTLLPYKMIDGKKDVRWNTKKVNAEVLQGILQGDSIPKIAKRLQNVTEMNKTSAIRNARTTVTSAECKGRQDSYERATKDGIQLQREWMATNDGRTRHSHRLLDGQRTEVDKPFDSELGEIMYPGDPHADPANVYNCRCTLIAKIMGFTKQQNKSGKIETIASNKDGEPVVFSEKFSGEKWEDSISTIKKLCKEYKTKLMNVNPGSHHTAGSVQISGTIMNLSSSEVEIAIHEFAHTISMENQTKFGLYDESDFWKEIKAVQRKYKRAVKDDSSKWISSYEHSSKGADEFMAEAFTQATLKEMKKPIPEKYGNDFTYSKQILEIIKRYFGR